ncbi:MULTISPECIES: tubulin-like doman-containing protein [Haloferax]|uniref:Tubulin like n=1 Tax=Haloferax marinum TaxID=2666143 RepID=A0A6A8GCA5_9EURY|nr:MULTISPECIES: tubulin-like doman-containing protein [Haloferax]KAB1190649.1 hypothetical protein Hfx1150_16555 [Haloferax sp. CBA1150]MRW98178.1 hypothetical protein [Haloferax marinum]
MSDPLPTFVVGVGQAGIAMMNALHEASKRNETQDFFKYFAIDTDSDTLSSVPPGTKKARLNVSDAHLEEDKATYPYLSEDAEIGSKGAERQRPVGRYKLDSRGKQTFDDYFKELRNEIREHYQKVDYTFRTGRDSYNIFLLHSLGGGTGSGTFPLLSAMLNKIAKSLDTQDPNLDVYLGAVGAVPKVDFDPSYATPPGNEMYYPNAYASLNDISTMIGAGDDPVDIPLYSKNFGIGGANPDLEERVVDAFEGNSIPLERAPFNDHWLIGVDEDLIVQGRETTFVEDYTDQLNRRVAEVIYALSEMEQSVENWSSRAKGDSPLGTIGHAKITVPHEQVHEFCEMKDRLGDLETLVEETIPGQLETLQDTKDDLEGIKQDPTSVDLYLENANERRTSYRGRFERELGAGNSLVMNSSAEDVERVLDSIEHEANSDGSEGDDQATSSDAAAKIEATRSNTQAEQLLLATEELQEMLDHPNAAPSVVGYWEEVVSGQWKKFNMADKTRYGGAATTTLEGKVDGLKSFFKESISEFEGKLENVDLDIVGQTLDALPPWHPFLESEREEAERKLDTLRDNRDTLLEANGRYKRVEAMKEVVQTRRKQAKQRLDQKISDVNSLITERQNTKDETQAEIDELERSIESEKEVLASSRTGKRLGVFPLRPDKLDELTLHRVENELNSLDDYVANEFIDERKVENGVNKWLNNATSWNDSVGQMNYTGIREVTGRQEMWLLYHDDNEKYAREKIDEMQGGVTRRSGSDSMMDYINDPYSIMFVSFDNQGPVEGLRIYQRMHEMAEKNQLSAMAGKYNDYRQSFAYPEWYDRDVWMAFHIKDKVEVPKPPELDIDRVKKPDLSGGEKKNYINRNGLDSYIWHGTMWEQYEMSDDSEVFDGFSRTVDALTWRDIQKATPDADLKSRWIAGQVEWDDVLQGYVENIENRKEIQITFE